MGTLELKKAGGFTLLEVLVAMVILTVAAVALMQAFGFSIRFYASANDRWRSGVELWNRSQEIRGNSSPEGEPFQVIEGARPLYRIVLEDSSRRWEVLRAGK